VTATAATVVNDLSKAYGAHEAVRGVSFAVRRGEVFGLLGPNGAGKTTTVEILEGHRARDGGEVSVLGHDPGERPADLRSRVGIVLQSCGTYPHLTVRETLEHWASLYPAPRRVGETLRLAGLQDAADRRARTLSGGQQRRLDFALALVGDPELIFLDEPTTGFDPAARRAAWAVIAGLRELGKTIFLTTHYLDEAQALADRVAIIKAGTIVAQGPPQSLGAGAAATVTEVAFLPPAGVALRDLPGGPAMELGADGVARLRTELPTRLLAELCGWAAAQGVELERLEVTRPTLEDVYLELITPDVPVPAA
jgi:ABC-2 type transport system ATP-binding protein